MPQVVISQINIFFMPKNLQAWCLSFQAPKGDILPYIGLTIRLWEINTPMKHILPNFITKMFATKNFATKNFATKNFAIRIFATQISVTKVFAKKMFANKNFAIRIFTTRMFAIKMFADLPSGVDSEFIGVASESTPDFCQLYPSLVHTLSLILDFRHWS